VTNVPARVIRPKASVTIGVLLIVLAFLCVAVMSAFAKAATGIATGTLVFFQNVIALLLFAPWALGGGLSPLKTKHIWLHILRGLAGLLSHALMFAAVKKMPLMNAVLLTNSAPLFIPLIAWVWLKEKVGMVVWTSLSIGFLGILLILKPGVQMLANPAALIATSAALFSAFALVAVNQLSRDEPVKRILFYYFLISSVATAPFALLFWKAPTLKEWLYLAGIGILMAVAQLLIILAYQHATATSIAPFNYCVVIFSGLIGWFVWKNEPTLLSLLGVVLLTAGGVLSTKFGGPNSRGHLGWIGHWNLRFHRIQSTLAVPHVRS
jgi:drug/metabolite transporter (DMT)-like permease